MNLVAIDQNICAIPKKKVRQGRVIENFAWRIQVCRQRNGGHLEHVL